MQHERDKSWIKSSQSLRVRGERSEWIPCGSSHCESHGCASENRDPPTSRQEGGHLAKNASRRASLGEIVELQRTPLCLLCRLTGAPAPGTE